MSIFLPRPSNARLRGQLSSNVRPRKTHNPFLPERSTRLASMPIGSSTLSYAVGSAYGPRSARWVVSASGRNVYVTCDAFRHDWHASLHTSGRWHIRGHASSFSNPPPLRRAHRSQVAPELVPVGLFILIPDYSLCRAVDPERERTPDFWLPRSTYGGHVEIAVNPWTSGDIVSPGDYVGAHTFAMLKCDELAGLSLAMRSFSASHRFSFDLYWNYRRHFSSNHCHASKTLTRRNASLVRGPEALLIVELP